MRRFLLAAALALTGLVVFSPSAQAITPFGLSDCTVDTTAQLNTYFAALPARSVVTLPHNGCFRLDGILHIASKNGLTINGNGATLLQVTPGPMGPVHPILFLTQDSNVKINNLTIDGAYNFSNGGDFYEGDYGIMLEGDTNVLFNKITDENIQGDCLLIQAGNDISPADTILNKNITMTNSTLENCGYHGITLEAGDGFSFSNNKVTNVDLDAMDFEVDGGSTYFSGNQPQSVAEDNIKITNNTWTNWGDCWYCSLQAQTPGVQQQHVTLSGNTLNSTTYAGIGSSYIEIWGTVPSTTTTPFLNLYLSVTNNKSLHALGAPFDEPNPAYPSQIHDIAFAFDSVSQVTMTNNIFPVQSSTYGIISYNAAGITVKNNNLAGATGVLSAHSDTNIVECGNHYSSGSVDSSC